MYIAGLFFTRNYQKFLFMGVSFKKLSFGFYFTALFLCLVGLFSFFRLQIADFSAGLLALTHEIKLSEKKAGEPRQTLKFTTNPQIATRNKKKKVIAKPRKPVTLNLPKTKPLVIVSSNDLPDWSDSRFPLAPKLRLYKGSKWNKNETKFKLTTDGYKLYIFGRLFDKDPADAVTRYTDKSGGKMAWKDDSIEVFLMKNKKSKYYCQYIVSVSGAGCILYHKVSNLPNRASSAKRPKGFQMPRFDAYEFNGGFEIELKISLSNIGIRSVKPGDSFLMQIIRNYRGQGDKESVTLQLFPVFIYADTRSGINNHDRRAFQPVKIRRINE
jgi:hypothetical protein